LVEGKVTKRKSAFVYGFFSRARAPARISRPLFKSPPYFYMPINGLWVSDHPLRIYAHSTCLSAGFRGPRDRFAPRAEAEGAWNQPGMPP
jgi:hypothetical protein